MLLPLLQVLAFVITGTGHYTDGGGTPQNCKAWEPLLGNYRQKQIINRKQCVSPTENEFQKQLREN